MLVGILSYIVYEPFNFGALKNIILLLRLPFQFSSTESKCIEWEVRSEDEQVSAGNFLILAGEILHCLQIQNSMRT